MKNKSNPEWDRIAIVINYSGAKSVNGFSNRLGLHRAERLYQIKKGNNGISKNLAKIINAIFPQFSVSWLMFGDSPDNEVTIDYNEVIYNDPVGLEPEFKKKETGLDFIPEFIFPPTGIIKIQLSCIKEKFEITLRYVSNDL